MKGSRKKPSTGKKPPTKKRPVWRGLASIGPHDDSGMETVQMPPRRRSDSGMTSAWAGLPTWARIAFIFGFPTVGVGFFMWDQREFRDTTMARQTAATDALNQSVQTLIEEIRRAAEADANASRQQLDAAWRQYSTISKICVQMAKTDAERVNCVMVSGQNAP